ncbi:ABC transporter ATP-binding protein [Flexivirga sp. B27]
MRSQQQPCAIEMHELTKRFGPLAAVDQLSFTVQPGEVTGFLGANGAGKTTTLRMLLGLVTPSHGEALIGGRRYQDLDAPARTVGALLEANGFHPGRNGRDHLRVCALAAGVDDRRVDEVLDLVGLSHAARQNVRGYSLGMRQRLGVATAILAEPPVLICDEPTNGLDPEGIRWLRDLLREQAAQGRTVLVSSHLLAEMQQLVDSVVIIDKGRLVHEGAVQAVGATAVRATSADPAALRSAISAAAGAAVEVEDSGGGTLVVRGIDSTRIGLIAHEAGIPLSQLVTETNTLERLFFSLTSSPGDTTTESTESTDQHTPSGLAEENAR